VVVARATGSFAVMESLQLRQILSQVADRLGPGVHVLALSQLPGLAAPCQPVETTTSEDEAQRRMLNSPQRRTIVLDKGVPVGLLYQARRGGIMGGLPSTLYGRRFALFEGDKVDSSLPPRQCPHCRRTFPFYDARVVAGQVEYHCPHCGHLFPAEEAK
jgi:DNA-directed RNA polymerase subunit RPC12/RpoP